MQSTSSITCFAMMVCAWAGVFVVGPAASEATELIKQPGVLSANTMECTPIIWQGQPYLFESYRGTVNSPCDTYLALKNLTTGVESAPFGDNYSMGCAYVDGGTINVFAAKLTSHDWFHDIYRFTSTDTVNWTKSSSPVVARSGSEHLLNSSVCQDPQGYLMAYESNKPVKWCFKFARSTDLATWTKLDVPVFAGPDGRTFSACPAVRYSGGYYYAMYTVVGDNQYAGQYVTEIARSKDLATWTFSEKNPVLAAGPGEGINNSDIDLFEVDGKTYVYYATGDQVTWLGLKRAVYDGPMSEFFESYFPVPEPSSCALLGGAALLGLARHRYLRRGWGEAAGKKVVKRYIRRRLKLK